MMRVVDRWFLEGSRLGRFHQGRRVVSKVGPRVDRGDVQAIEQ